MWHKITPCLSVSTSGSYLYSHEVGLLYCSKPLMCVQVLQECFEKKDVAMLQDAVTKIPKEEAEYHIKRCIDSGLWVPGGADKGDDEAEDGASAAECEAAPTNDTAEDNVYSEVDH